MPLTYAQFKQAVRGRVFPQGEARNLRPAHDKSIQDALIDLQRWVECLQSNNTHLVPQCATYYKCGLTNFDFPRSMIQRLSVIDKINPDTGLEDAEAADDYCTEIEYTQVEPCVVRSYLAQPRTRGGGCCYNLAAWFALPYHLCGNKRVAKVPTDAGVPEGLEPLPLGQHYPQTSTNATCGRALTGVWALENGRVWVAPWIQSTETVVVKWNGIKRDWKDADLVDDDPGLFRAVENFLRWEHARDWDTDLTTAQYYEGEYRKALADLMYDCAQENALRDCATARGAGGSGARGIAPTVKLYYNDRIGTGTFYCADGTSRSSTVAVNTVASTFSIGDANERADAQARSQAEALCESGGGSGGSTYSSAAVTGRASCPRTTGKPAPDGDSVTVNLPAGYSTSSVSQDDADNLAQAAANAQAKAQLNCTYHNAATTQSWCCPDAPATCGEGTVAASDPDCDKVTTGGANGQSAADQCAKAKAIQLAKDSVTCPEPVETQWNDALFTNGFVTQLCNTTPNPITLKAIGSIAAHLYSADTKEQANCLALSNLNQAMKCYLWYHCNRIIAGQEAAPAGGELPALDLTHVFSQPTQFPGCPYAAEGCGEVSI